MEVELVMSLKMEEQKGLKMSQLLMQPGMKQSGILIMIQVAVMVISMLQRDLTPGHG